MGDIKKTPDEVITEYKKKKNKIFSISLAKMIGKPDFTLKNADLVFLGLLVALTLFGSFMIISTLSYQIINNKQSLFNPVKNQIMFVVIGFVGFWFFQSIDYHKINYKKIMYLGILVLILNIYTYFGGYAEFGAKRWIKLSENVGFQASEPAKYFLAVLAAYTMSQNGDNKKQFRNRYFMLLGILLLFAGIIAGLQSNLSTAMICFAIVLAVVFASESPSLYTTIPLGVGIIGAIGAVFAKDYRRYRVTSFIENIFKPGNGSDQLRKSLYALGLGGLTGSGIGSSRMKAYWLPIAENDFIFAIICEELGFIGASILFFALAYLVYRGIKIANNAPDKYGYLLGLSLILVIAFQIMINISVVIGLFPVTGVTLPFISKGGTSLVINLCAMGILLNISKQSKK